MPKRNEEARNMRDISGRTEKCNGSEIKKKKNAQHGRVLLRDKW